MKKKSLNSLIKTLLSLLVGILIIWAMYRNSDWGELWAIAESANFSIIALSLIFGLIGNLIRGMRWELFLNALGYHPPRASIIYATFGNYAVNFVLPRAGDLWRCGVVSKYDKIPFSKTVETFFVDKVVELIAGLSVILITLLLNIEFFISYFNYNDSFVESITNIFSSFWIIIVLGLVGLTVLLTIALKRTRFMVKLKKILSNVKNDLKLISKMREKKMILVYTILLWVCFYLYFYICFFAFDFTKGLGPMAGLVLFAMTNIGISVPIQGGIGPWHFMASSSLIVYGVAENQALAFAGVVFAIQSLWQITYGLFGVLAFPFVKRKEQAEELVVKE